ncbi:MAG: CBS domain-containing protein, partial [Promethearchaeota archaeon]
LGFFKLGESAKATQITDIATKDLSIEAMKGLEASSTITSSENGIVRKGSIDFLTTLKNRLKNSPLQKMDILLVTYGPRYSGDALKKYIASLGVRYVVFQKSDKFEAWIYASNLTVQLENRPYSYDELKSEVAGASNEYVEEKSTASEVLEKMQDLKVDSLPVIDANEKFKFFVNRGDILSRLMTTIILPKKPDQ